MTKLVISFLIHLGKALAAIQFKDQILSYEKNYDSRFNTGGTGRGIFDFVRFRARTSNDHHYNDSRNGDPTFRHHDHASDNHGLLSAVFPGKGHVIGVLFSFAQRARHGPGGAPRLRFFRRRFGRLRFFFRLADNRRNGL